MKAWLAMFGRQLGEARWFLGLSGLALGGLGWLMAFQTSRLQTILRETAGMGDRSRRSLAPLRFLGGPAMNLSTGALEVARWNIPFVPLIVLCWAIARGSVGVAGELERGTLDLVLSRPVSRMSYLLAQIGSAVAGLLVLVGLLVAGLVLGNRYYRIENPPAVAALLRPAANLAAMGWAIYGYALALSALDVVRWRPNLGASGLTLGGLIAYAFANQEAMERWRWLEKLSVFRAYAPVEAVVAGRDLAYNGGVLLAVGLVGVIAAAVAFAFRDLPAGGG